MFPFVGHTEPWQRSKSYWICCFVVFFCQVEFLLRQLNWSTTPALFLLPLQAAFYEITDCKWPALSDFCICYVTRRCVATTYGHEKRHEMSAQCVWSEDNTVVPYEAEDWRHTATACWQKWPTLMLHRWTGTLTDVCNPPSLQNEPPVIHSSAFHLLYFFTVRKCRHSCLLELAAILGIVHGLTSQRGQNWEKETILHHSSGAFPGQLLASVYCWVLAFLMSLCPRHHCAPVLQMWLHFLQGV